MTIIIYRIRNTINGKIYIGQTSKNIATRFMQHTSSAKKQRNNCYKLENAINKYGKENFTIEEILRTENEEDANQLEISFISKYDTINRGYNIQSGGRGNRDIKGSKNPRSKLTDTQVDDIKALASSKALNQKELATKFNVNRSTIQRILYNTTWTSPVNIPIYTRQNKLTIKDIREIKTLLADATISKTEIAKRYGVSKSMIGHISKNRIWSDS